MHPEGEETMFRRKTNTFLILLAAMVLIACQPAATPFSQEEFEATEAPETEAPVATELPTLVATQEPALQASDAPQTEPTAAAEEETVPTSPPEAFASVVELTNDNWAEEIDSSPLPVLLYFWSSSNDTSVEMLSALEEIANEYTGSVKVMSVNLDDYPDIGYYYTVFADGPLPTVFLIIDGEPQPWLEGATSKDEITAMLDQQLAGNPNPEESNPLPPVGEPAPVVEITSDNFDTEVLQSSEPVLIHFWAEWSGPSRVIQPALQELANEYTGRLKVGEINVDEYPDLVDQFGVEQLPTFILVNFGSEQMRIEGVASKDEITAMLDQQLP
jgi:thioredoxin 1